MQSTGSASHPAASATPRPRWNEVLRALREAHGVTQDGWAVELGVSRKTVQRWEAGGRPPDARLEAAILACCRERNLFRLFAYGPLAGLELTPDLLQELLAEARLGGNPSPAPPGPAGVRLKTQPKGLSPPARGLPVPLTSFVGREEELAAVRRALGETRLLTLTGAGGCGKTRLALALAEELLSTHSHGVWFVDLATLADLTLLPETVAAALGVEPVAQRPLHDVLIEHLAERRLLLILDNCEHLLPACAVLVETLLRACPHLEVVTTSREPLGLLGETVWRVPSLALPDAIRLFVERARLYRPEFTLTDAGVPAVARICARLDNIPLAIELAAARVRILSVEQIAARLHDRFHLLTGGSRTALPRQRTLRATLDWSYDLLSEPERALLRRLSVFAGGFTLEAAEAVCGERSVRGGDRVKPDDPAPRSLRSAPSVDVLDLLARLVDKSLVIAEARDGTVRYRLLETVRQYAAEQLTAAGEADATREWHALWCLALAEAAWPHRMGPKQQIWLERLTLEQDNLRAVLGWCLASEPGVAGAEPPSGGGWGTGRVPQVQAGALGLHLGSLLWWWWQMRGHLTEGRRWLSALLERGGHAPPDVRARALEGAAWLAADQGDYDEAARLDEACLALWRELGETADIAGALNNLGVVFDMRGDHARAAELYGESLALARELREPTRIARALNNLGISARQRGEPGRAVPFYEETLALAREMGDTGLAAKALLNLGNAHQDQGALDQALAWYRESLVLCRNLQDRQGAARCLQGMASVAVAHGAAARAARLCGAAAALREVIGVQLPAGGRATFERIVATARAMLGEADFTAAWAAGQTLSLDQAVAEGLSD